MIILIGYDFQLWWLHHMNDIWPIVQSVEEMMEELHNESNLRSRFWDCKVHMVIDLEQMMKFEIQRIILIKILRYESNN